MKELKELCEAHIAAGTNLPTNIDFYSVGCPELGISLDKGRFAKFEGGAERRVDQIIVQFSRVGAVKNLDGSATRFGHFSSNHPKTVKLLVERIERLGANSDVCDSERYESLSTPLDQQLVQAKTRTIAAQNELLTYLEKQKQAEAENAELRARLAAAEARPPAKTSKSCSH